MFIFSLAVILAIIGVSSWSFFGKQPQHSPIISTASTSIDPPIEISPPPSSESQDMATVQKESQPPTPEISSGEAEEAATATPGGPEANETVKEPAPTVSETVIQKETDKEQEILIDPADRAPLPPETVANEENSDRSEPEPVPAPTEEISEVTETAQEPSPPDAEAPLIVADAEENAPISDKEPSQPAEEDSSELVRETPEKIEEGASDASLSTPTEETANETSETVAAPTLPVSPEVEEEAPPTKEPAEKVDTEVSETFTQDDDTITPETPQAIDETVEAGPELVEEVETTIEPATSVPEESIAEDTRLPWQKYAAAFDEKDNRPRIAIVISEAGINSSRTREVIESLPPEVTLGFNPYGQNLQELVDLARAAGHEVLLQLPMEPMGYPRIDPGPQAMRTDLSEVENRTRLEWSLNRFTGYAGVTNQMGSKFTSDSKSIQPILRALKEQGYLYLDSRTASNSVAAEIARDLDIPVAINNRFLDHKADGALIDARLAELESIAQSTGSAIGIAYPHDETFRHLADWAETLDQKGLTLAPVSALVEGKEEQ